LSCDPIDIWSIPQKTALCDMIFFCLEVNMCLAIQRRPRWPWLSTDQQGAQVAEWLVNTDAEPWSTAAPGGCYRCLWATVTFEFSTRHGVHGGPKVVLEEATQTNRLSSHERRWHRNGSDRHRVGVILAELNLVVATLGAFKKIMRNIQASTGGTNKVWDFQRTFQGKLIEFQHLQAHLVQRQKMTADFTTVPFLQGFSLQRYLQSVALETLEQWRSW